MPVRRQTTSALLFRSASGTEIDPVECFQASPSGHGTDSYFVDMPVFANESDAARAWQICRREIWASAHRFTIPKAAQAFDGLTMRGLEFVRSRWTSRPFDIAGALAALAEDRRNLAAFRRAPGARIVGDFLELLAADLDTIEAAARELAALPGDCWKRPYPAHLGSAARYGGVDRPGKDAA